MFDTSPSDTDLSERNEPIEGSIRLKSHEKGKLKIYLYPNEPFNQIDENDAIAVLFVGQTGSGKTTLLNSFVNALYGIKLTDDFRYIIINEDHLKQLWRLRFGDTSGIAYDMEIIKQIKEAFETKISYLNAICFVASSSNVRLTLSQKYVFGNIINLFGKDVKKNFIVMLTFCDGKTPQVINALQSKECDFSTIIPEIDEPMSREVLKRRERIKVQIEGLRISLNKGLSKMNEIKQIYKQLYLNRDKVKDNENFTFTVCVTKQIKVHLKPGEYATNCLRCHKTCYYPCGIKGDIKRECSCIGDNGYCKVCCCNLSHHANESYRFDYVIEKKQETADEIYKRYNEGKRGAANAESILKKLEEEYYKIQMEYFDKEQEIVECVNRLSEIALNGKITSSNKYLDMLIQIEEEEKKDGYKARIEGYKQLKQANEMIEDIMKNSATKKSKEEIKAEVEATMKELKEEGKSKMNKNYEDCVVC
ncbi:hypothetical protein ENUP19_0136G0023 [Entamoeba nuttalli]|uniref:AIG1-type G domain-containing protein n=1 Tax=Entamoeba nuttalli TaxID=412467 RepID=A0ABQ0DKE5_9EUKA